MRLLERSELIKTSKVDHAAWNFAPILGWLQRTRFKLVLSLLQDGQYARLIEVGYGSGVFMPELSRFCRELYGLDIHDKTKGVTAALAHNGTHATLVSGSVTSMPFPDGFVDCIVAVSALEYVDDVETACKEMRRVLRPGGILVLVTPAESPLLDAGLKLLGEDPRENYVDRRKRLIPALLRHFSLRETRRGPALTAWAVPVYTALRLTSNR